MNEELDNDLPEELPSADEGHHSGKVPVSGMYKDWFLDYASYVILERAVPAIEDGLKPVQRRILHSMEEMDDGRFNKVANIIGHTMQYHPHGDQAIGAAIVGLGQKDLLIETQGNWGDVRTGDGAAAPRYIEARLSKFALEVAFNADTTVWQLSYDGRKREPVTLPMKFPLLLAQGVEGIAVGLATKVLPHNFIELIKGSIDILKGKKVEIYPDFLTGGYCDVSDYAQGGRGGKVKVRAKIETVDKKTLIVREIPFGTTTSSLIDSIVKANERNKIKIKKVTDNTAKDVEIVIELAPGISPDITIDALYAFTECEISISPNACVIIQDKPHFLPVNEILRICTEQTKDLLRQELEIKKKDLQEKWHFSSLEKIFIENRIYRDIEEEETWEGVIAAIDRGLEPHKAIFYREITEEDIVKLTEIRIKRISKFDAFKADEYIRKLEEDLVQTQTDLDNLTAFAIAYFQRLLDKYGKGRERKTELRIFDSIQAAQVAVANQKLYINREEGFVGFGLKKDEYVCDCSDLDDIIVFREDGKFSVTKIAEKTFVGKSIIHAGVFKKGDERMTYNAVYWDAASKRSFVKRFPVTAITRDKEYDITKGAKGSKVLYFSANPNGEAEVIGVYLTQGSAAKKKVFDFDFSTIDIKGRGSMGNILTKYPIRKIVLSSSGSSTLGGLNIWLDETVGRLNTDGRGRFLGNFEAEQRILVIHKDGSYELTSFELTNRYEMNDILIVQQLKPGIVVSAVHYDAEKKNYFVKRFQPEGRPGQRYTFISEAKGSKAVVVSTDSRPNVEVKVTKGKAKEKLTETIALADFIDVKGWKSLGNRLSMNDVVAVKAIDSDPEPEEPVNEALLPDDPIIDVDAIDEAMDTLAAATQPEPPSETPHSVEEEPNENLQIGSEVEWDLTKNTRKIDDKPQQGSLF
ncbi:MAG: DNA gyrase/topoisomerase IV subunit A [Chitinophagales bacterium]|nr:DNA gyrase/topoisomerase IV subunit A [Chitinophagales bacterium]